MGQSDIRIQVQIDSKTGEARIEALGDKFDKLGKKGSGNLGFISREARKVKASLVSLIPSATSLIAVLTSGQLTRVGMEFENSYFSMSKTFQNETDRMIRLAEDMAERFDHFYDFNDIAYAFTKTADSMQRYGITGQRYIDLVARAADVGAAKNLQLKESIDRLESAMRGEAEASEYLGVTLNDTYMKNMAFNGALKDTWERLSDNEKAQHRFNEMMNQTAKYTDSAKDATNSLSGALKSLWNSFKDEVGPGLAKINAKLAEFINGINKVFFFKPEIRTRIDAVRDEILRISGVPDISSDEGYEVKAMSGPERRRARDKKSFLRNPPTATPASRIKELVELNKQLVDLYDLQRQHWVDSYINQPVVHPSL